MQFIDEASITVAGGRGGDGIVAWRREKYVPKGGPAGGDGGRGGDVILEATPELSTLIEFRFKKHFAAESGKAGSTSNKSGRSALDLIIPVPVGTLVYSVDETGDERLMGDLSDPGQRLRVAKGGRGGLGNQHFATSARQAPRFAEKGEPPESASLRLELKLLADCGIVGLPNAGKSTFLAATSHAKPKIADYPFTTLSPNLGVVRLDDREFVLADIPGLIEDAHQGAGLGTRFLGHVERTSVLLHLVDATAEHPAKAWRTVRRELEAYGGGLAEKPEIVALSKIDALSPTEITQARRKLERAIGRKPLVLSAASGTGVREALAELLHAVDAVRPAPAVDSASEQNGAGSDIAPWDPAHG